MDVAITRQLPPADEVEGILEALRTGRVPQHGLSWLATGIDDVMAELDRATAYVGTGSGAVRFLRGGFGSGKTFVARYAQERARAAGYAAAWLVVSETELRLWKPDELHHGVCESLATSTMNGGALVDLVDRWVGRIEERLAASGLSPEDPRFADELNVQISADLMATGGRAAPLALARAVQALVEARARGQRPVYHGLLAWLSGSRNIDGAVKRAAGLKGEIGARDAVEFIAGVAAIVRLAGYRGLVVAIDELETILRTSRAVRGRSLNAMRQLIDLAEELPGVLWLVTGTPELFDSAAGVAGLQPLHDRIQLMRDGEAVSMRQPQISLPRFDGPRLLQVGERVAALYPRARENEEATRVWIAALVASLTAGFDGRADVVPRRFLRELVHRLDLVDTDPTYDPLASLRENPPAARPAAEEAAALKPKSERVTPGYVAENVW